MVVIEVILKDVFMIERRCRDEYIYVANWFWDDLNASLCGHKSCVHYNAWFRPQTFNIAKNIETLHHQKCFAKNTETLQIEDKL